MMNVTSDQPTHTEVDEMQWTDITNRPVTYLPALTPTPQRETENILTGADIMLPQGTIPDMSGFLENNPGILDPASSINTPAVSPQWEAPARVVRAKTIQPQSVYTAGEPRPGTSKQSPASTSAVAPEAPMFVLSSFFTIKPEEISINDEFCPDDQDQEQGEGGDGGDGGDGDRGAEH